MATFIQEGDRLDYTPAEDVVVGQVVVQGQLVGVATRPIAANALGALAVTGVFRFPKATDSGSGMTAGTMVYYDEGNEVATEDADGGNNVYLGKTVADCDDADETVRVRLSQ